MGPRPRGGAAVLLAGLLLAVHQAGQAQPADGAPFAAEEDGTDGLDTSAGDTESPGWLESLLKDPTLGGKLHLTYRATYTAKVHDFKGFRYPFSPVSETDLEHALQLRERHKDISDQDVDQYFSLRLAPLKILEGESSLLQSAGGEASFRYFKDIDGSPPGEEARGHFDRFHGRQALQLQTLNARLETLERHVELVLGRQYGREAEWLHFDGATATFRGLRLFGRDVEISGFTGARVTLYSSSASSLDGIHGGHVKAWITEETRLEISDVYYADNTLEVKVRQGFKDRGWITAGYRQVNEDPHSVTLEGSFEWPKRSFTLHGIYTGKLGRNADDFNFDYTQSVRRRQDGDKVLHFNIGDIEPYDEVTLELRKGLWPWLGVFGGGTLHRLRERDREDSYNTDFEEVWIGLDLDEPLWRGFTARGTFRYVHTDLPRRLLRLDTDDAIENLLPDFQPEDVTGDGEPSFLGFEALVEQDFQRKASVGATAVLRSWSYQSNFAEVSGLTASSLGVHARWRATARTQWLLSYSYDRDLRQVYPDLEALHTVKLQFVLSW